MTQPAASPSASLKRRIAFMFAPLVAFNAGVWIWAFAVFGDHPALLGTCALAYVLGLRHAVDPDHIAAIDNVTRKLMQEGRQPISVGLWFAIGHSALICIAVCAIAFTATSLSDERFECLIDLSVVGNRYRCHRDCLLRDSHSVWNKDETGPVGYAR